MKARLPQGYGGGGASNLQQIARQAQKLQEDMDQITAELDVKEYSATAGGDAVKAVVTGKMEVKVIDIKPEVVDPEDVEMLSDLVIAAVNEALRTAAADKNERMEKNFRWTECAGNVLAMPSYNVAPLSRLIEQFERLPGIGHKSAQRLAYYVLGLSKESAENLAGAILDAHEKIHYCKICCNLTDQELCPVCRNESRDKSIICVVEDPRDVIALERTHEFNASYHVLHGAISPLNGIGPDQLCIKELLARINNDVVKEVIMATNPTVEGEATAMYVSRLLKPLGVKVTRLAYGIPVGGDLEYADEVTLSRAIEGRSEI